MRIFNIKYLREIINIEGKINKILDIAYILLKHCLG